MGLSRNPESYPRFFWRLLEGMQAGEPEICIPEINAKKANKLRYETYGFIYALEFQAKRVRAEGNMQASGTYLEQANAMRKYMIRIEIDGVAQSRVAKHEMNKLANLLYIDKDMTLQDETAKLEEALEGVQAPIDAIFAPAKTDEFIHGTNPEGAVDFDDLFGGKPFITPDTNQPDDHLPSEGNEE